MPSTIADASSATQSVWHLYWHHELDQISEQYRDPILGETLFLNQCKPTNRNEYNRLTVIVTEDINWLQYDMHYYMPQFDQSPTAIGSSIIQIYHDQPFDRKQCWDWQRVPYNGRWIKTRLAGGTCTDSDCPNCNDKPITPPSMWLF